jgi:hypothetical protein
MKKVLVVVLATLGGIAASSDTLLHACGAKFLVSSRGAHYQRVLASIQPTRVLWYWKQDDATKEEDRWNPDASKMMEEVGHTVDVAHDADAFLAAARDGDFDVLIVPIDEARRLRTGMASLPRESAVLPVMLFPTRSVYSEALQEFDVVLKLPTTSAKLLAALEKARRLGRP